MKKSASALFAIVAVLVFSQVASASTITVDFTYSNSGNVVVAAGWFTYDNTSTVYSPNGTATGITPPGYNVTAGSISVPGNTVPLFPNPSVGNQSTSPDGSYYYDDLFFPAGPTGLYLDNDGLLFGQGTGYVVEINIWGNGSGANMDSAWEDSTGVGGPTWWTTQDNGGTFAIPEGGSGLSMLALCGLGLAGAFLFKAGNQKLLSF